MAATLVVILTVFFGYILVFNLEESNHHWAQTLLAGVFGAVISHLFGNRGAG